MRTALLAALLACLPAVGCGADGPEASRDGGHEAPAAAGDGVDTASAGDRGEAGAPEETAPTSPPEVPVLEPETPGELRTYRILLVNPRPIRAVVYADAGAERVLLDTVPRRDSSRVNVEVRATRFRLIAIDGWGERLGAEEVEPPPDSLFRWEVPAASGGEAGGSSGAASRP